MPNAIPVTAVAMNANSSTLGLMAISFRRGRFAGAIANSIRMPAYPMATPTIPPAIASVRLSTRSCLTMRPVPAPPGPQSLASAPNHV